jgi:hypothetical protein
VPVSAKPVAPNPKSSHPAYEALSTEMLAGNPDVSAAILFGIPCLQVARTAFVGAYAGGIAVKLPPDVRAETLALTGARLFDPSGRGRPMAEWVVVPAAHEARWDDLAEAALTFGRAC